MDPVDNAVWIPSRDLKANHYNPNVVFTPELKLLEHSILTHGWVFAIVINPNNMIIDGFHRWRLSMDSQELVDKYVETVPCVTIDLDDPEAMLMTIQMNRAKGTHVAVRMSGVVQELVNDWGYSIEQIAEGIGANKKEVKLLLDGDIFKHRDLKHYKYSKAWIPKEVSVAEREKMLKSKKEVVERDDDLAPDAIGT